MSLEGEERKNYIIKVLNLKGKIKVNTLAKELNVTTETIRRHLEDLEKDNLIKRVYGGAIKKSFEQEPPYAERTVHYIKEKRRIGKKAAELVQDNEVVMVDIGTTTLQMVKYLNEKENLTIITSSVAVLKELSDCNNNGYYKGKIILIGGEVNIQQLTISGNISEKFVEGIYVDKAFVSVGGISMDEGLTTYDLNESSLTSKIIKHARQSIILADHSKIGIRNYFKIADFSDISSIICDKQAPEEWNKKLTEQDVEWIYAPE